MLGMNWLKRKLKTKMAPIEHKYAQKMTRRLSGIYAFLGWNFVSLFLYWTFKQHIPEGPGKTQKYLEVMNVPHATVIEFSGFNMKRVNEYEVDRRKEYMESKKGTGDVEVMIDKNWTEESNS
ncbi:uncharacterized protein LOC122504732 [Leptopilina heterotoma]|uniref:uncharacterized protein LOC122504732 n=1 Tax=Leptopilina heterotoma TaxID=63436 RepID=UPI001CA9AA19|nr:uncharacterized protein LOC122504732 [Leptopilina heterotoma]